MRERTTEKQLEYLVERINTVTNSPLASWTKDQHGKLRANIGNYHLDWAYGGVMLVRMHNEGGGIVTVTGRGTKRECYNELQAFLRGHLAAQG